MEFASFDELHTLAEHLLLHYSPDEIEQYVIDYLTEAYIRGRKHACEDLGWDWTDYYLLGWDEWQEEVLFKKYDGQDVRDRIRECIAMFDVARLAKVIDTEYHRIFNTGGFDQAEDIQTETRKIIKKVWHTRLDDRVRDTHDYIEAMKVPITQRFYTFDGDSARFPGDFKEPGNNIACRCWLTFTW